MSRRLRPRQTTTVNSLGKSPSKDDNLNQPASSIPGAVHHYNESRPHSALDWKTPTEFARQTGLKHGLSDSKEPEIP
ncbi:MAG: integrase core domain-containing protein, partial [Betaproteobacteria bacterium]